MIASLFCKVAVVGIGANLIPPGSSYTGGGTYTLNVLANTTYDITWGANDSSVNICGTVYNNTGQGTNTVVYTASCTTMVFTGTGGSVVTARVVLGPGRMPIPSGFTFTLNSAGTNAIASWNTPPSNAITTQVWTSTDNLNYTLAATVAAPGTSASLPAPAAGTFLYCKLVWCGANCGQFTTPLSVSGQVASFAARVITNGGAPVSTSTLTAMSTFDLALNTAGITGKMISVLLMVPDNLIAATTPLYHTLGNNPWTNHNFVSGDLTIGGLKGDGSTKYLDTGVLCTAVNVNDVGLSVYVSENSDSNLTSTEMGFSGSSAFLSLYFNFDASGGFFDAWDQTNGSGRIMAQNSLFPGFLSGSHSALNTSALYRANSDNAFATLVSNNALTQGAPLPTANPLYCFATNSSQLNVPGGFSAKRMSFAAVHASLTSAQTQALYNAIHQFRIALGGGYVYLSAADAITEWSARVVANGGAAPSAGTKAALQTFYSTLVSNNLLTKMITINCVVPDNLIAAITPLFYRSGADPWTNNNFVAGDLSVNGLTGAATKSLATKVNLSRAGAAVATSLGMHLYVSIGNNAGAVDLGNDASVSDFYVGFTGTCFLDIYNTAGGRISAANNNWSGFMSGNRTDAASSAVYQASSVHPFSTLVSSTTEVGTGSPSGNIEAYTNTGGSFSTRTFSFIGWSVGLGAADAQALYNAVQALRVSLGGGSV